MLPKAKFVLDKFHMHKYIIAATSPLADSAEDARSEIYRAIHKTGKKHVKKYICHRKRNEKKSCRNIKGIRYILSNWSGIQVSTKGKDKNIQCSAEGHVSHVFSDRMSFRPLVWSRTQDAIKWRVCECIRKIGEIYLN